MLTPMMSSSTVTDPSPSQSPTHVAGLVGLTVAVGIDVAVAVAVANTISVAVAVSVTVWDTLGSKVPVDVAV